MHPILLTAAGHRRQPVTLPGYHAGRPPRSKGRRYPADPPTVEEIISVMRTAGAGPDGVRLRGLIVVLWRAGLRIGEALWRWPRCPTWTLAAGLCLSAPERRQASRGGDGQLGVGALFRCAGYADPVLKVPARCVVGSW